MEANGYEVEPGTDLEGAKLGGAYREGANLTGVIADEGTTWPEGFDPEAVGVTFED